MIEMMVVSLMMYCTMKADVLNFVDVVKLKMMMMVWRMGGEGTSGAQLEWT